MTLTPKEAHRLRMLTLLKSRRITSAQADPGQLCARKQG
jgi:hypothetical protein